MKKCINCYQELPDNCKFCTNCGAKQPEEPVQAAEPVMPEQPVQAAEPVMPEQPVQPTEPVMPEQPVQPTEPVMPEQPVQPEQAADPYQNNQQAWYGATQNPNQNANQSNPYDGANNYQYGQNMSQQNQNFGQQNQSFGQPGQNYDQQYQNNQGYYQQNNFNAAPQKPLNWVPYLVLSIISTLCCCLPFGVVGIVFSAKINSAMTAGNYEEAMKNAKTAKIWIIVSFAIGILTYAIYFIMMLTGAVSGAAYYSY